MSLSILLNSAPIRSRSRPAQARRFPLMALLLPLVALECQAQTFVSSALTGGVQARIAVGAALAATLWITLRVRGARVKKELQTLRDLAQHREYERNMAQQELVRRLEEERELAKGKLQFESQLAEYEKYASLAQLALGAAHEINNPLLGILSHLELELRSSSAEQRTEIEQCIHGAKRISSTVRGLLDYARPGPLLLSKVNLSIMTSETLRFLEHHPMFRQIELENRVSSDVPNIVADGNQLSQILMNLLLNAAQATSPGGRITVTAAKVDSSGMVEVRVSDTGCGISPDILPHIFEPFFTTKRGQGTGLGLCISQSYARSHGGEIQVESCSGQGTSVRVILPIQQAGKRQQVEEEVIA